MTRNSRPRSLGFLSRFLVAGLVAVAGSATLSPAAAQVPCPQVDAGGNPVRPDQHIFCGDINGAGGATGYHSRPGGLDPVSITILAGTNVTVPAGAPAGIYRLNQFNITQGAATGLKPFSTMFPDACAAADVLAAIANANLNRVAVPTGGFHGPSGANCQAGAPLGPFDIKFFVNAAGAITTAYPNY
jgi:hypothetical protein